MKLKETARSVIIHPAVNRLLVRPLRAISRILPAGLSRVPVCGLVEFGLPDGRRLSMFSNGLDPIAGRLFWKGLGGYEPHITGLIPGLCRNAGTVIDVGANTGFLSLLLACAAGPHAKVFAFEPVPRIFGALKKNIAMNGLGNCTAINSAVGDTDGDIEFYIPRVRPFPQSASLTPGFRPDCETVKVGCVTLDGFAQKNGLGRIGLVKIDVEAASARVLAGMRKTLERDKPAVLCEILPEAELEKIHAILGMAGYAARFIAKNGTLEQVSDIRKWSFRDDNNFLLTPA